jgi:uncharacterized membrane protein
MSPPVVAKKDAVPQSIPSLQRILHGWRGGEPHPSTGSPGTGVATDDGNVKLQAMTTAVSSRLRNAINPTWPYVVGALVLGYFVPRIRGGTLDWVNPNLGTEQVIAFLSAVSSGMMAFTGIVFALLFIVLQFGSTAYSPHIVPILTRNPALRHAGGVFTGTFLYTLMALRIAGAEHGGTPAIAIWIALVWLLASVYLLMRLVGVFGTLAVTDVLDLLSAAGHREIEAVYGPYVPQRDGAGHRPRADDVPSGRTVQTLLHQGRARYVTGVDVAALVALAREAGGLVRVSVATGDSVTAGTPIARVEGAAHPVDEASLRAAIGLDRDRTSERGPKYSMRLLVDVAIRALSPAVNDPTTAVHVLDQLEDLLRQLGQSNLEIGEVRDSSGTLRLVYPATTWDEYLELGLSEIQYYGAGALQIERRLGALFQLLATDLPDIRRSAVEKLAGERLAFVQRAFPEGALRDTARLVDYQGVGHPAVDRLARAF